MIPLRPYQLDGIEQTRHRIRDGKRRILFVLATGGGKTVIAAHIVDNAVQRGKHVLFVAHRRELIKQTFCKLIRNGMRPDQIGIVMAGVETKIVDAAAPDPASLDDADVWRLYARRRPAAPMQIASIDTLRGRAKPLADLVIIDEAHRALAKSYKALADLYPEAILLGLTATPYRADGRGLGDLFEELVVIASPRLLVEQGFLVEPRVWGVARSSMPDLAGIKITAGDYNSEQLAAAVDRDGLVGDIVEHWERHGLGLRTVVFPCGVAHSKRITERFCERGHAAEHLDGETPAADRDAILARLERGETTIVSSCGVLCEGWDQPSVKVAILARPTKSCGLYLQMAGRILRPWQDTGAIILDHAGCVSEHGFPTDEREFSLEGKKKNPTARTPPAKTCERCFAVVPAATRVCPAVMPDGSVCGFVFPAPEARELEERPGRLQEIKPATLEEKWAKILATWHRKNAGRDAPLKPGWCAVRFKELYGAWPPRSCKPPVWTDEQTAARVKLDALRAEAEAKGLDPAWAYVKLKTTPEMARAEPMIPWPSVTIANDDLEEIAL